MVGRERRHEEPGGYYHVWSRGSSGQAIALDTTDRRNWVHRFGAATVKFDWTALAFILMTNHFHFLIRIDQVLSEGMQWLNGGYARLFNARHGRDAHVFRNRFSARLIESEEELLSVLRYIERNAVTAGICRSPADTRWSSYRAIAGLDPAQPFLARAEVLAFFGDTEAIALERYRSFVLDERA
jgi:putative transposase